MRRLVLACGLFLLPTTVFGQVSKKESVYAELAKAPEKARAKSNPFAGDPDAAKAGALLYERHCSECHGDEATGKKGPSLLATEVQEASPGAIFWLLTNGVVRKGMPVWSKLPEAQRWQLVSFIKSLKNGEPPPSATQATRLSGTSQPR